jgi:hypothetical protein
MTPQQIVGLGIRLLALVFAYKSLAFLGFTASSMLPTDVGRQSSGANWIAFLYLTTAAIFWFMSYWIAIVLLPRKTNESTTAQWGIQAASVGCSLIGLWFLVSQIPDFIWYIFRLFLVAGNESFFRSLDFDAKVDLVSCLIQISFSVLLVVRSGDFGRLVAKNLSAEPKAKI